MQRLKIFRGFLSEMAAIKDIIQSNLKLVKSMLEEGKTDKDISKKLDISYASYKNYKAKDLAIKAIYDEVKNTKNEEVENSLFKLCNGFVYHEEVATKIKEEVIAEDGKTILVKEDVKVVKVKKYKTPDLAAQKYYLNNRNKARWKDDPTKADLGKKGLKLKEREIESKEF